MIVYNNSRNGTLVQKQMLLNFIAISSLYKNQTATYQNIITIILRYHNTNNIYYSSKGNIHYILKTNFLERNLSRYVTMQ